MLTRSGLETAFLVGVAKAASQRAHLRTLWSAVCSIEARKFDPNPQRLGGRVERIGFRLLGPDNCYPLAVAASALLRFYGHTPEMVIGVANGASFEAHAWVEVGEQIVIGGDERVRFVEVWRGQCK